MTASVRKCHLTYAEWGSAEYRATLGLDLPRPESQTRTSLIAELQRIYRNPPGIFLLNAGRNALRLALETFREESRWPEMREVIVPAYICQSVVDAVSAAGCTPVFADIDDRLNMLPANVEKLIGPATLAVLVAHMYGAPADIETFEKICRTHGVKLIDDAAQVAGISLAGRPLGTFGDVGILSFAQSKTLVTGIAGSGGVLIVNRPELMRSIKLRYIQLLPSGNRCVERVRFLLDYQWKHLFGHTGYYLEKLGILRAGRNPYAPARLAAPDARIALIQARKLDTLIADKVATVEQYAKQLKRCSGISLPQYSPGVYLTRIMIELPSGADREAIRSKLRTTYGIETRPGYPLPTGTNATHMPTARAISPRLLELPMRSKMPADDIEYVCTKLAECLQGQYALDQ